MRRRTSILIVIACLKAAASDLGSAETPSRSPEAEEVVFNATNRFRIQNNLRPLIWDQRLSDIAYGHSVDMIVRSFFDHVDPDGQNPRERVHRQHRQFIGNAAENLSVLVGSPPFSPTLISEQAMNTWLKSPAHRANLLDPAFTHVGIGVAIAGVEVKVTQSLVEVRGILKEPLPERLRLGEKLKLEVTPYPQEGPKAKRYILEPLEPPAEPREPANWPLSATRPSVAPGRYTIQFCFPMPRSRFLEVFPGPQIEIIK